MTRTLPFAAAVLLAASPAVHADPPAAPSGKVQFGRDILPILSANCFTCHGPDEKPRKAGLRLDLGETATKKLKSGARAVVPGDVKNSELIARIVSDNPDERMPPAKTQKTLKDSEKALLKRWIEEGAAYQKHWAFVAPRRPALPAVAHPAWPKNPIDRFVLARLEKEGLKPMPEADRYTLARRVTLDLTGLPPTIEVVDRFANDKSPDAYEKFVDQVLKAPTYGERWAHVWLDLARYADSNGFATDNLRTIWKYRDWVIDALNANMPYDRFTIEQIAGDLLPNATQEQIVATAFHRNTLTNDEGGTSDEEFRVAAVVDRVNTTLQVWMGITMACAQCHDHKYDPISQEEYFRLFAIFNQTEDSDKSDNSPLLSSISPEQQKQKTKLESEVTALEKELLKPNPDLDAKQKKWEKDVKTDKLPPNVKTILALDAAKRNAAQQAELTKYFRSVAPELKKTQDQLGALKKQLAAVQVVKTPIMKELPDSAKRVTKIHIRGNFLDQGKQVAPGIPAVFPPLPGKLPANRLAIARWLVAPENPLTARVAVDRFWQQLFGVGLVDTPDDFGIRGKLPNHPELLDWLATDFASPSPGGLGWDVKKLLRLMVTSATYRQSSAVTPTLLERDPDNKLFARPAFPCASRGDPRPGAVRQRPPEPEDVRRSGSPAVPQARPIRRIRRRHRLGHEPRRRQTSPGPVHPVAAHIAVPVDDDIRRPKPQRLHGDAAAHQHAAAGARDAQRSGVRRGRAGAQPAHGQGRRRDSRVACDLRLPAVPGPAAACDRVETASRVIHANSQRVYQ